MNYDSIWNNFLSIIQTKLTSLPYKTWFADTKLLKIENKKMNITVWVDGAADASTVVATGNPDAIAAWSKMKNNIVSLSQDMYDRLDDKGIGKEGAEITIDFLNDNDLNKSLITCKNGECIYDCTE